MPRDRNPAHAASRIVPVVALTLVGAGCVERVQPVDITGRWQSEIDQSVMLIEESGLFAMDIPGARLPVIGTVTIEGDLATFRNRPETRLCVDDDGVYRISVDEERLTATLVRDTCASRVLHMSRPWRRLSADQSPSNSPR